MSHVGRKRFIGPSAGHPSDRSHLPRFVDDRFNRPAIGGYRPCYPKLSDKHLNVYMASNEQRPEIPALEAKVRDGKPLSLREFRTSLDRVLEKDCITVAQMVGLANDRPIGAGLAATLFELKSEPERYTLYSLRSVLKMKAAGLKGRLSDAGHDPTSFDRFSSKSSFYAVESVAIASTPVARKHWRMLNDGLVRCGKAFVLDQPMKQMTVMMLARMEAVNRFHFFSSPPRSVVVVPDNLVATADAVLEYDGKGNMRFDVLTKTVLKRVGVQEGGSGLVRFLREFDWTQRCARLVAVGEAILEKEINSDDQPPERRTAKASGLEDSKLMVMFRLRCKIRRCRQRFKNDYNRTKHMEVEHSLTTKDVKIATDMDAEDRSKMYEIVDEHAWLAMYPFLEDREAGEVHRDFVKRSTEFCEMHAENLFRLKMIENELELWQKTDLADQACADQKRWRREMLEEGRAMIVDEERFGSIVALSTAVTRRRIDENRNDANYLASMRKSVEENPMVRLARMNESDFDLAVKNNADKDVSAVPSKSLAFDAETLQSNARRAAALSFRLLSRQLDPDGEEAVRNARKRVAAMYDGDFDDPRAMKIGRGNGDEEEDDDEGACSGSTAVSYSVPVRCLTRRGYRGRDRDDDFDDPSSSSLVLMKPTDIRVHRLDAYEGIKEIVDDVMDPEATFDRTAVGHAMNNVVNFTKSNFKLSKAGQEAAFRYCFGQLDKVCGLPQEDDRRRAVVSIFADVFKFFNSNTTGCLNRLFAKRKYERSDPSMEIVEVDEKDAYPVPSNERALLEIPYEGLRITMEYDETAGAEYAEEVVKFQRGTCAICMYEFGCRSLEAIPCAAISRAKAMGKSAPTAEELVEASSDRDGSPDWNGVHLFHTSCLREMIRSRAKDTRANGVECPTCRVTFYDGDALNVVRTKLVQSKLDADIDDYDDDVFNVKSELGRDRHFLVSCQQDMDRLRESVKKLYKRKNMSSVHTRADPTKQPYEIGPVDWYTDSNDDVSDDVDAFIAKLRMENKVWDTTEGDDGRSNVSVSSFESPSKVKRANKVFESSYGLEDYVPKTPLVTAAPARTRLYRY